MNATEGRQTDRKLRPGKHGLTPDEVRDNQVDRLVEAMVAVVADSGYRDATVSNVIARAGVSRATFYQCFRDRGDLFLEARRALDDVIEDAYASVRTRTEGALAAEPASRGGAGVDRPAPDTVRALLEATDTVLATVHSLPGAVEFAETATPIAGPEAAELHARIAERWSQRLRACLAGSLPPGPRGEELARMGFGAAVSVVSAASAGRSGAGRVVDRRAIVCAALMPTLGARGAREAVRDAIV